MANPFQQQSRLRKLIYAGLILGLFSVTLIHRRYVVATEAEQLGLRAHSFGEVELTGSAIRLLLTGSRGFAVTSLWMTAIEKQKKHEWNELELLVNSLTKLQPHFITPWLFQSWNLAYNVSVEADRVRDKFFYITRGVELLGAGERQNVNHPDLRHNMGIYYQHKIGLSDEAATLMSLFQMSCMEPSKRDPNKLRTRDRSGRLIVDLAQFEQFCQQNPQLVRRLRDALNYRTAEKVVDFLVDNADIPGRPETDYQPERQFPVLPRAPFLQADLNDDFDNFTAARGWFAYSQEPLPPPMVHHSATPFPIPAGYRKPRYMAIIIFRGYPARAQEYVAERVQREGWFEGGWTIKGWFRSPDDSEREVVVGQDRDRVLEAWTRAYQLYKEYGEKNGLYYETPEALSSLTEEQRYWYERDRQMTNFPHHYFKAQVEARPETVAIRKQFFLAEQLRSEAEPDQAIELYQKAIDDWRKLLLRKENRDFRYDESIQEETYEIELKYLDLLKYHRTSQFRQILTHLAGLGIQLPRVVEHVPPALLTKTFAGEVRGPFDVLDDENRPLVLPDVKDRVLSRKGFTPSRPSAATPLGQAAPVTPAAAPATPSVAP